MKSLRGIAALQATVGDRGFEGDRRFLVTDESGMFLTQRSHPRMALVDVAVEGDRLRLDAPGRSPLRVPRPASGARREVVIWKDRAAALDAGEEAAAWLSDYLGERCRLVYMPDDSLRPIEEGLVGFADAYPFLLITSASLAELARRGADVPMIRFRPNIVVEGAEPFAEDQWSRVRIGEVEFRVAKPCARCSIPTIDPATGEAGVEPTRTLATFRRVGNEILFGQNLIHAGRGVVRVGDRVQPTPR